MGCVYGRPGTKFLWLKWTDRLGREHRQSSETDDPVEAAQLLADIEHQEQQAAPPQSGPGLTVERFFYDTWLPQRKRSEPYAWKTDASNIKNHFLPLFGDHSIAALASDRGEDELREWALSLPERRTKRDGSPLASRTVWNLASIVRVFFADALERKVIRRDPCAAIRWDRHLPAKRDKVKGWRQNATGFSLGQVVALTTDPRIPEDRRLLYAVRFLGGGLRPSSEANLRWRDLDRGRCPLWRLTVSTAFDTLNKVEKPTTKTGVDYLIPVHPVLEHVLDAWWTAGWAQFVGRAPTPEDLIVPRQDGTQRRVTTTRVQFHADLDTLGFPRQRQYESRATFRNLCLRAGASEFHVNLITHPKARTAADLYTRIEQQWDGMCVAVRCIDPAAWEPPGPSPDDHGPRLQSRLQSWDRKEKPPQPDESCGGEMVTPTGLEPMSST